MLLKRIKNEQGAAGVEAKNSWLNQTKFQDDVEVSVPAGHSAGLEGIGQSGCGGGARCAISYQGSRSTGAEVLQACLALSVCRSIVG